MNDIVPLEYVTILQAVDFLKPSMFGGKPDRPAVTRVRQMGFDVSDGEATERAIAEIWKAVDSGKVQPYANGGKSRKPVKLSSAMTEETMVRNASGRGFTFVRPSNPAFHQLAAWFGRNLSSVTLLFQESEIRKLASALRRARRGKLRSDGKPKDAGRPSRQLAVQPVIRHIVEAGKWTPLMGVKALTSAVNRRGNWEKPMSEDTVVRALDQMHAELKDRRYERARLTRRPVSLVAQAHCRALR